MSLWSMNIPCTIKPRAGNDIYGGPAFGADIKTTCSVVKLKKGRQRTSVRLDSSASIGHADEFIIDSTLLLPKSVSVNVGDVIIVHNIAIRVLSVFPRFTVMGRLDHYEVDGTAE